MGFVTLTFHLSAHFFENSAKMTFSSGCFFLCSSRHVCTKNAYAVIRPLGFASVPFPLGIFPRFWKTISVHINIVLFITHKMNTKNIGRCPSYSSHGRITFLNIPTNVQRRTAHDSHSSVILNSRLFQFNGGKN